MNWLTNFVRPKIQALVAQAAEVPDNLWEQMPGLRRDDLPPRARGEPACLPALRPSHAHRPATSASRSLFDDGSWTRIELPKSPSSIRCSFRDRKRYTDRLKEAQAKTGEQDAHRSSRTARSAACRR